MNSFITYLKERFNIFVWGALALFLLLFSKHQISLNKTDANLANLALIFLIGNHLLYLILYKTWKFKHFLPLLKYPLIFIALHGQFSIVAISLFLAFMVYEIMDDKDFPISKPYACLLTIAAFALLLENLPIKHLVLFILLAVASFATVVINRKYFPYIFLLLYLFSRLISLIHEI